MITSAEFIEDIIIKLLNKPLSSNEYYALGGSKDIFRRCVERCQGIGPTCSYVLSNLIIQEIKYNELKKQLVLDYLKQFLTIKEKDYLHRNPNDIKTIIKFIVPKFSKKASSIDDLHYENHQNYLKVIDLNDLIMKMKWNIDDYTKSVVKIWKDIIGNNMPEEYIGDVNNWKIILNEHPETRKVLLNEKNEFIGYWEFDPLFDEAFSKAKNGILLEGDMTINDIPFLISGTYNIYFENICISSKCKNSIIKSFALRKMLFSIIGTLEKLAMENIFINEICTWAYTNTGIVLCKSLGLKYYKNHSETGEVYCGTIHDLLNHSICDDFTKIKELYAHQKYKCI